MLARFALSALVVSFVPMVSAAQGVQDNWPNWYVGVQAGVAFVGDPDVGGAVIASDEYDEALSGTASLGFRPYYSDTVLDNTRFELSLGLVDAEMSGSGGFANDLSAASSMFNMYVDFWKPYALSPYIGAGVGVMHAVMKDQNTNIDDSDAAFSYQFMGGLSYENSYIPQTEFNLGYRYQASSDLSFDLGAGNGVTTDFDAHIVEFGTRFYF